jgi:hypothetical protein
MQRGFRRIGIALAVPCFLAAAVAIGVYAVSTPVNWWDEDKVTISSPLSPGFVLDKLSDAELLKRYNEIEQIKRRPMEPLYAAGALALAGVVIFIFFTGFGWVVAGFARD